MGVAFGSVVCQVNLTRSLGTIRPVNKLFWGSAKGSRWVDSFYYYQTDTKPKNLLDKHISCTGI